MSSATHFNGAGSAVPVAKPDCEDETLNKLDGSAKPKVLKEANRKGAGVTLASHLQDGELYSRTEKF